VNTRTASGYRFSICLFVLPRRPHREALAAGFIPVGFGTLAFHGANFCIPACRFDYIICGSERPGPNRIQLCAARRQARLSGGTVTQVYCRLFRTGTRWLRNPNSAGDVGRGGAFALPPPAAPFMGTEQETTLKTEHRMGSVFIWWSSRA
jgi:hypothetical protein